MSYVLLTNPHRGCRTSSSFSVELSYIMHAGRSARGMLSAIDCGLSNYWTERGVGVTGNTDACSKSVRAESSSHLPCTLHSHTLKTSIAMHHLLSGSALRMCQQPTRALMILHSTATAAAAAVLPLHAFQVPLVCADDLLRHTGYPEDVVEQQPDDLVKTFENVCCPPAEGGVPHLAHIHP